MLYIYIYICVCVCVCACVCVCVCVCGLKEAQGYWKLDRTVWRTRFRKSCGPAVGVAVVQLLEALCCNWFRFPMGSLRFFIDLILQASLWPWGRLRHLRDKYTSDISLEVGGLQAVGGV